jgi:hypothetical protein
MLCAAGIWWLAQKASSLQSKSKAKNFLVWTVAFLLLIPYLVFAAKDNWRYFNSEKQDWSGAMHYLESQLQPNDIVITGQAWSELGVLYYATEKSRKARIFIRYNDAATLTRMICEPHAVWYINWGPLPDVIESQVKRFLRLKASFPGLLGDIKIYHKPADPHQLQEIMEQWKAHPELF